MFIPGNQVALVSAPENVGRYSPFRLAVNAVPRHHESLSFEPSGETQLAALKLSRLFSRVYLVRIFPENFRVASKKTAADVRADFKRTCGTIKTFAKLFPGFDKSF